MIIVLGGFGYVGTAICKALTGQGLEYKAVSRKEINYADSAVLLDFLKKLKPSFLINAAGYTGRPNVDACEEDKANCLFGNAVLPGIINDVCRALDLPWGHISSGCIFTGSLPSGKGFAETDAPNFSFRQNNCSFYSGTKALGEETLGFQDNGSGQWNEAQPFKGYVWRLRIPFNGEQGPRNYLSKLMQYPRLLEAENSITELDEFSRACVDCFVKKVPYGIYNVTNPGVVSTRRVTEIIQEVGQHFQETKSEPQSPFPTEFDFFESEEEFMALAAKTPRSNCTLDSSKLEAVGIHLTPVEDAIKNALMNWTVEDAGDLSLVKK